MIEDKILIAGAILRRRDAIAPDLSLTITIEASHPHIAHYRFHNGAMDHTYTIDATKIVGIASIDGYADKIVRDASKSVSSGGH